MYRNMTLSILMNIFPAVIFFISTSIFLQLDGAEKGNESTIIDSIASVLEKTEKYSYELAVSNPDVIIKVRIIGGFPDAEGHLIRIKPGIWEGDNFIGKRILPFVLRKCFTMEKQDTLRLTINLDTKSHTFYAKGTAEAVFAMRTLASHDEFTEWIKEHITTAEDVIELADGLAESEGLPRSWKELDVADEKYKNVLDSAKKKYNDVRAGLILRFNKSYLYYGVPETINWALYGKEAKTLAVGSCSDLMYVAYFRFEYEDEDGEIKLTQISATEAFKGE